MMNHSIDDIEIDRIIRDELMLGIELVGESNDKLKVYPKISGLPNLGRTYFISQDEIKDKDKWVQFHMMQKYGDETYGSSAQLKTQRSNGTASNTASGSALDSKNSLISCTCKFMVNVPDNVLNESSNSPFNAMKDIILVELNKYFKKDESWQKDHRSEYEKIQGWMNDMKEFNGANEDTNKSNFNNITKIFNDKWKDRMKDDKNLKDVYQNFTEQYNKWAEKKSDSVESPGVGVDGKGWNPNSVFRIDVQTNFNEEWYKRKYKSGLLNKALDIIKTSAMTHQKKGSEVKKYSSDIMQPGEKRKLDSIQWKMTNQIARDYISMLLGWSREKVRTNGFEVSNELQRNETFGQKMADKALNNRGLLGRLKQKIFSGQQSNNVISVCFQLSDPNDGWEIKEPETTNESGSVGKSRRDIVIGVCQFNVPIDKLIVDCV